MRLADSNPSKRLPEDVIRDALTFACDVYVSDEEECVGCDAKAALAALVAARDEADAVRIEVVMRELGHLETIKQLQRDLDKAVAARDTAERERDGARSAAQTHADVGLQQRLRAEAAEASRDEAVAALKQLHERFGHREFCDCSTCIDVRDALRVTGQPLSEPEAEGGARAQGGGRYGGAERHIGSGSLSGPVTGQWDSCSCDRTYHDECPLHGLYGDGLGPGGKVVTGQGRCFAVLLYECILAPGHEGQHLSAAGTQWYESRAGSSVSGDMP